MKKNNINNLIEEFDKVHKSKYDYSNSEYINNRTKIEIICKDHGSFWQSPFNHVKGHGCPYCSNNKKMNNELFIKKSILIHGDLYGYDNVEYKNNSTPVDILCKKHGLFKQTPSKHLIGRGCSECGGSNVLTKNEFEKRSKLIHGDLYGYDRVDYKNARTKVDIFCKKHGIFSQKPNNHLSGYGCLICKSSKGEIKIFNYLNKINIKFIPEYYLSNINQYLDFYIPSINIGIEYDGVQHFRPIDFFGGEVEFQKTKNRDKIKDRYCRDNDIDLYRISYLDIDKIDMVLDEIFKIKDYS